MRHTISRNPFCGLGFRSLEHYQNSTPFSSPILGAGFRRYPGGLRLRNLSFEPPNECPQLADFYVAFATFVGI